MKLLSLECSAMSASVALTEDGRLMAESFVNIRQTHSQTLMPMVEGILHTAGITPDEVDGFAISAGPGSFTGVRIGVAALKGMAQALDKPCVGVSTLEAMAYQAADSVWGQESALICPVMDARCSQVYNALFEVSKEGIPLRRCEDRALMVAELAEEIKNLKVFPYLVGDGAALCYNEFVKLGIDCRMAPEGARYQRALGVAMAAEDRFLRGEVLPARELQPIYLRLPQAERDLKKRNS